MWPDLQYREHKSANADSHKHALLRPQIRGGYMPAGVNTKHVVLAEIRTKHEIRRREYKGYITGMTNNNV